MNNIIKFSLVGLAFMTVGAACQKTTNQKQSTGPRISQAASNAFGSLTSLLPAPQSGSQATDSSLRSSAGIASPTASKIAPEVIGAYTYMFTGTPLSLTETSVDVFERTIGSAVLLPSSIADTLGLGVIDHLDNPTINNITLRSGDEIWYIDSLSGTISMYLDASIRLANPPSQPESTNTSPDLVKAVNVASAFLSRHGISTAPYGQAITISNAGAVTPATASSNDAAAKLGIFPSATVQVVYPLLLNGIPVVQTTGEPMGLTVTVETETSTVSSVYGLNSLDFARSAYEANTDWSAIKKIAEQGGLYRYGAAAPGAKATTINLGTPDRVFMVSYLYENNHSRELYVPALRFPLLNSPDAYMKYVVVPLPKDLPTNTPIDILPLSTGSGSTAPAKPQ